MSDLPRCETCGKPLTVYCGQSNCLNFDCPDAVTPSPGRNEPWDVEWDEIIEKVDNGDRS